jgi:hypothetical protein
MPHLEYIAEFGSEKKVLIGYLKRQWSIKKFEMDQRKSEAELAWKRAAGEDECRDVAKLRKAVAESSVKIVTVFKQLIQTPKSNAMDEKIASLRKCQQLRLTLCRRLERKWRLVIES